MHATAGKAFSAEAEEYVFTFTCREVGRGACRDVRLLEHRGRRIRREEDESEYLDTMKDFLLDGLRIEDGVFQVPRADLDASEVSVYEELTERRAAAREHAAEETRLRSIVLV